MAEIQSTSTSLMSSPYAFTTSYVGNDISYSCKNVASDSHLDDATPIGRNMCHNYDASDPNQIISPNRHRNTSSISTLTIPDYMSAGQILPADGLPAFGNNHASNSSDSGYEGLEPFSPFEQISPPLGKEERTFAFSDWNLAVCCENGCGKDCEDDCDCKISQGGMKLVLDKWAESKQCCAKRRVSDDSDKTVTQQTVSSGVIGKVVAQDAANEKPITVEQDIIRFEKGGGSEDDDIEESEDEEGGGVLINSPGNAIKSKGGTDVFPLFNNKMACEMIQGGHSYGTMPLRPSPSGEAEYVVVDHPLLNKCPRPRNRRMIA